MARLISFCSTTGKNTGGIDCDVQLGPLVFMLIGSAKFTPSEYASEAALKAAVLDRINRSNGDSEKLYPWAISTDIAKTTEADTVETAGNGEKRPLRVAPQSYDLTYWNVGINQEAALVAFNGVSIPAFGFDNSWKMVGKFDGDDNFVGNKVKLNTSGAGFSTFANGPATKTSVSYIDPFALTSNAKLFEFGSFDTDNFEGLLDAELRTLVAPTGFAYKIGAFVNNVSIGKEVNLHTEYGALLADVDLWYGIAASNGATVAPTTVVIDNVNKGWTVTFAAAVSKIGLADVDELYAADVTGIEGIELVL